MPYQIHTNEEIKAIQGTIDKIMTQQSQRNDCEKIPVMEKPATLSLNLFLECTVCHEPLHLWPLAGKIFNNGSNNAWIFKCQCGTLFTVEIRAKQFGADYGR